jgi:O-Antigen ligase
MRANFTGSYRERSRRTEAAMSAGGGKEPGALKLAGVLAALGMVLWISIPRLTVLILPLAVALPSAWQIRDGRGVPRPRLGLLQLVLGLFATYLWANALWSENFGYAVGSAAAITAFLILWSVGVEALVNAHPRLLRALGIGLCAGIALGGCYLLIDALGSRVIWSAVRVTAIRLANPGLPPDIGPYGTTQHYVYPFVLNVGATAFTCGLFPALLVGSAFVAPARRVWLLLAGVSLGCLVVFSTIHGSSKIAMTLGGAVLLLSRVFPRTTAATLAAAWVAATLLIVPITQAAYALGLHESRYLPDSARGRIIIWKHTGVRVAEAPLGGIGIGSTRVRRRTASAADMEQVPRTEFFLDTSIHAHNFFLQAWYELGAIGAGFLLVIGLLILAVIRHYPETTQPYLLATFVAVGTLCSSTFSLFALWFIASILLTALCACLGVTIWSSQPMPMPSARSSVVGG